VAAAVAVLIIAVPMNTMLVGLQVAGYVKELHEEAQPPAGIDMSGLQSHRT
jgi:hypothetical protein